MEMESSRRPGLKKPRLVEDLERELSSNGSYGVVRRGGGAQPTSTILSRVRENDTSIRVNNQLQVQQQQQHQEIVSEYKSALAELTFNSKPIITNLTIIAGENLHAAKGIAAAICSNILEVPTEQKLPSLYLLDSIVKNIGRDYIRYFALRLPEVFGKVYRQVDASMHTSMRHLFGTWKGVFPPACLQQIEKEFGFGSATNISSSGGPTSRPDSQSQRPANSIHVNPKYLEAARQRLQQSNRAKGDEITGAVVTSVSDTAVPVKTAVNGRGRPWADPPIKQVNRDPRLAFREPVLEKKTSVYEDNEYGSDLSRHEDVEIRRRSERAIEQGLGKPWYAAGGNATDTISQRNPVNSNNGFANLRAARTSQVIAQPSQKVMNKNSLGGMSGNWKNFEEEEYRWDDMKSRLRDHDSSSQDTWPTEDDDKPEFEDHSGHDIRSRIKRKATTDSSSSMTHQKQATFGNHTPSTWELQDTGNAKVIPAGFSGLSDGPSTYLSGLTGMASSARTGRQSLTELGSLVNVSGSGGVIGQKRHQPLRSASPSEQSSPEKKVKLAGHFNHASQDALPFLPPSSHFTQSVRGSSPPVLHQELSNSGNTTDIAGQLAAIMKSVAGGIPNLELQNSHSNIQPPLPSGPPPTLSAPSSASMANKHPKRTLVSPPLPPGPPPPVSVQTSNVTNASPNPLSSLLNTLVGKGLISAPAKSSKLSSAQGPSQVPHHSSLIATRSEVPVSGPASLLSHDNVWQPSEPKAERVPIVPQPKMSEIKDLIGFEFKPELLRESHPSVISDLFDDLPHECSICGLRLKLEGGLERHLEWHALRAREASSSNNVSKKWFLSSADWVSETTGLSSELEKSKAELDVPADESQCACLLCGELFEDFYSHKKEMWMYKGAVYMIVPVLEAEGKTWTIDESSSGSPIVHASCISPSSVYDLGLAKKVEQVN
ncbi:hypothetical protein MKW94_012197 [Papaver nudicaule]|uniref:CID domain-containing protein n=1 Tax=Papaver nudicaule TaxID=74823 RepID=A0AA41RZB9_PAPNU|nr:hypothetical protein [Papaver nudicaule]